MPESSRLEGAMDRQRVALGLTWRQVAERAGISYETLRAVRKGDQVGGELTRRGIERAFSWKPGSFEAVEAGGKPTVMDAGVGEQALDQPAEASTDPQVEAILTILAGLPDHVQDEVRRRLGERLPREARQARKAS